MFKPMLIKRLVAAAVIAGASTSASAAGILSGVDILNITDIFESSLTAGNMSQARTTLTNEGATITNKAIGAFGAADLVGIDILYVGLVNNGFTASQLNVIQSFVAGGGGLVAVGTERAQFSGPSWEQVARSFGVSGLGGDRNAKAAPTTPASPIVAGPFGTATSYQPAATGAFATPLPAGSTVVWEGVDNNPIIVTLNVTGRAFFFGDTNFMQDPFIGNGSNRIIWGNAFAFSGRVDGGGQVPEPGSLALLAIAMLGAGMRWRQRAA